MKKKNLLILVIVVSMLILSSLACNESGEDQSLEERGEESKNSLEEAALKADLVGCSAQHPTSKSKRTSCMLCKGYSLDELPEDLQEAGPAEEYVCPE